MLNYTLRPLEKLFTGANPVTKDAVLKLIETVKTRQAQKLKNPAQKHSALIEEFYLAALDEILHKFSDKKKLPALMIRQMVDKYLRRQQLYFLKEVEEIAHDNLFYGRDEADSYDLAFYHPAAPTNAKAHHHAKGQSSIFYARLEARRNEILIGNLQIDDNNKVDWENKAQGAVLLAKKNLYRTMLQESIHHALKMGAKKIMFQTADSMSFAQFDRRAYIDKVTITEKNLAAHEKAYMRLQSGLTKIKPKFYPAQSKHPVLDYLRPQTNADTPDQQLDLVVVENNPRELKYMHVNNRNPITGRFHWAFCEYYKHGYAPLTHVDQELMMGFNIGLVRKIADGDKEGAWYLMVELLKAMSGEELDNPDLMRRQFERAIDLQAGVRRDPAERDWPPWLNDYFIEFGYDQKFMARHPEIKMVQQKNCPVGTLVQGNRFYYAANQGNYKVLDKSSIKKPRIGKEYMIWSYQGRKKVISPTVENFQMLNWYEVLLPEILTEFGLKVKKVVITTKKLDKPVKFTAWQICAGLEEFANRPVISFASGPELKTDLVPRSELEAAARKFGLGPAQLKIVNDWITTTHGRHQGIYQTATDQITLSNRSLSLLAHESTHRLINNNLIPAREYKALVAAGRNLAAQTPALEQRLRTTRTPAGTLLYPTAQARNDEYAALFVEAYYAKNPRARRCLTGRPLPVFQRIMNYATRVTTLLAGTIGKCAGAGTPVFTKN